MKSCAVALSLSGVSVFARAGDRLATVGQGGTNWWFVGIGVICLLLAGGLWLLLKNRVTSNND